MTKQILINACKYALGLALLGYVIWRNWAPSPSGAPGLADALGRPVQWLPLAAATLCCLAAVLLTFVRWYVLVRAVELPFTLVNALRLGMIGFFLSTFLPGSIGGDVIKAAFLARQQSRRTVAVATVLLDRVLALWGLVVVVALVGSGFWLAGDPVIQENTRLQSIVLTALAAVAGTLVLWFGLGYLPQRRADRFAGRLTRIPKVGGSMAEFWRAVWMYRCRSKAVAVALALALVGHLGFVLTFHFSSQVLQDPAGAASLPSLAAHFVVVPIGMVIQALFPAPGGVGGGEYGYGKLYTLLGCAEASGVLASLVQRVIMWGWGLVGYVVYLTVRPSLAGQLDGVNSTVGSAGEPAVGVEAAAPALAQV